MNEKIDFTIGADPEFLCTDSNNRVICAYDYLNCGEELVNSKTKLGCDGCDTLFELRPSPSKNPLEIVSNIHQILLEQANTDDQFLSLNMFSGSCKEGFSLGGHIHFGLKANQINFRKSVDILDNYLGAATVLIEDYEDGKERRQDCGYGNKGDYREQPWGFEYRTPASWISSPYVASAITCLSKTIMHEVVNNPNFVVNAANYFSYDDFVYMEQDKIRSKFEKIWDDITKMELYPTYKQYIDLIFFLVKNQKNWIPAKGMKDAWGLVRLEKEPPKKISMSNIWNRFNV